MKATLSQIEAFYWIARLGSFRGAAGFLHVTQPTLTLRIQALETMLGRRLFDRAGREVRLTGDGKALLPRAEQMMSIAETFGAGSMQDDPLRGQLRLGAPDSFGLTCMPSLLQSLRRECPELTVGLTINNSAVLSQQLNKRDLNIAFLANPRTDRHVRVELLGSMALAWIASTRVRLPKHVTPRDLVDQDILTNPDPSNLMLIVQNWFASADWLPPRLSTCTDLSVILRLAATGAGVAVLPTAILPAKPEAAGLQILQTRPVIPREQFFAAYLGDKSGSGLRTTIKLARRSISDSKLLS